MLYNTSHLYYNTIEQSGGTAAGSKTPNAKMNGGEVRSDSKRCATEIELADDEQIVPVFKAVANGRSKKVKVGSNVGGVEGELVDGSVSQLAPQYRSWKSIQMAPHSGVEANESLVTRRATRKAKMCRNPDMAYLDDVDWDILLHEQNFFARTQHRDNGQRRSKKINSYFAGLPEPEEGSFAAVYAGLKACEVSPLEKIKFNDVLECKGGLRKYLQCRNHILGLWNKDLNHILPLSDCGVSSTPMADESPQSSLVRNIYAFLDQSGYINTGVASLKEVAESALEHNIQSLNDCRGKSVSPLSESDKRVDSISHGTNFFKPSTEGKINDNNSVPRDIQQALESSIPIHQALKSSAPIGIKGCSEYPNNASIEVNLNLSTSISYKVENGRKTPADLLKSSQGLLSSAIENRGLYQNKHDTLKNGRTIIIIGAGPAGLSAARHLQRHGFQVIVLEARDRIGGRVFTDRTSLSVPVDLGASIITGYEADVSTQRRPDPSALVCTQMGLDLTVLNSDCPIYDTVTGHKVPEDVDKAVEEEYKSLLDDMLLLVAEKGEHAMNMSLESGLECALQRRCEGRSKKKCVRTDVNKLTGYLNGNVDSKTDILHPLERRVMDWHFAHLEYGCAALLKEVSLPYGNQDDLYGGFGGAHCMIKGGYSAVVESLGEGLCIHLNYVVTGVTYHKKKSVKRGNQNKKVKVSTSNGKDFFGDAVLITVPLGCLKRNSIEFSPPLPPWKCLSIQRLGFGVINKIVLEFPVVFWNDSVDYFGATAEETNKRGHCFMFLNVGKTVGAPVLVALVVGEAAVDGQNLNSSDHVNHALVVLRKLFGASMVHDPIASVVTDWGRDPYSYGAYSYVAIGASGEDYDILGKSVENCLFFAGEATCKEHPDTVGGAIMSGLREAEHIMNILNTRSDFTAEVGDMEAAQRLADSERIEIGDIMKRLNAAKVSNALDRNSLGGAHIMAIKALEGMFPKAKSPAARLFLAKKLSSLPLKDVEFCWTEDGLSTLNQWILDSLGKDGTKLLRQCLRLLKIVKDEVPALRLSGIVKTLKDKVCVHTSRNIRADASYLVDVWAEGFRREKSLNGGLKSSKHKCTLDSEKPPCTHRKPQAQGSVGIQGPMVEEDKERLAFEEEQSTLAAKGAARAAVLAAAELISPSPEASKQD